MLDLKTNQKEILSQIINAGIDVEISKHDKLGIVFNIYGFGKSSTISLVANDDDTFTGHLRYQTVEEIEDLGDLLYIYEQWVKPHMLDERWIKLIENDK